MRAKFDEQLHMLNQEMMHMGSMIEDKIQKAIEALMSNLDLRIIASIFFIIL